MTARLKLSTLPHFARWSVLLVLSALFASLLTLAHLPAALLLGALVAGVFMEVNGAQLRLPKTPAHLAQAIIGCLVANAFTPDILHFFLKQWPLFLAVAMGIIVFNCLLGWTLSRTGTFPGTTAIWGLLPGGAAASIVMAEHYGADVRLVAFMQYLRIAFVALFASIIGSFWVHGTPAAQPIAWFPPIAWTPFAETLAVIVAGVFIGRISKSPAGIILGTIFLGTALNVSGIITIELPRWLLAIAYMCLGWQVGFRFTHGVLMHALRLLPRILISLLVVILFCAGIAYVLAETMHVDFLTAYLATNPGGFDAAAVIAASTHVNMGFVMTMQSIRLLLVLLIGPALSRFAASTLEHAE